MEREAKKTSSMLIIEPVICTPLQLATSV